ARCGWGRFALAAAWGARWRRGGWALTALGSSYRQATMPDCVPYPALEGSITHVPRRSVVALVTEAIGTPRERGRQCERGGWAAAPWSGERPPLGVGSGVSAF